MLFAPINDGFSHRTYPNSNSNPTNSVHPLQYRQENSLQTVTDPQEADESPLLERMPILRE
ncbi:MAG: hypothetical protein OSA89_19570 [Mariniblastus sp.]|nr:hypothetical protein [Mariniblastus sp.]